ncbi:MAG: phage tail protein I [Roseiflexaceae bacterium]
MATDIAQLIVRIEGQIVQTVALIDTLFMIGRTPDNDLSLPHPLVARQHAELRLGVAGAVLTDLGSPSGVFIGSVRLLANQPQVLPANAIFRIGPFEITYQVAQAPGAATSAQTEASAAETAALVARAVPPPAPPTPPRQTFPAVRPQGPVSRYLSDLPVVYHDNDFLGRFLHIFESIWEPSEQREDHIAMYFDPSTCPAPILPWLAHWLNLELNPHWPEARQRVLLSEAVDLYRWRGTRYGLTRMIELCTGMTPEIVETPERPFVMQVHVNVPADHAVDRALLEHLIMAHKPAHIGYTLEIGQ